MMNGHDDDDDENIVHSSDDDIAIRGQRAAAEITQLATTTTTTTTTTVPVSSTRTTRMTREETTMSQPSNSLEQQVVEDFPATSGDQGEDDSYDEDEDEGDEDSVTQLPWPIAAGVVGRDPAAAARCCSCASSSWRPWLRNLYQSWTFSYMNPIFVKGQQQFRNNGQHLDLQHLYAVPQDMQSKVLVQRFWEIYHGYTDDKTNQHKSYFSPLAKTLWHLSRRDFVPAGFWELLHVTSRISMPLSLRKLLLILEEHPNESIIPYGGLTCVFWLTLAAALTALAQNRMTFLSTKAGIVLRAALTAAIYQHALQLSPQQQSQQSQEQQHTNDDLQQSGASSSSTMGEITNLVATDTQKLYDVMIEAHNIWSCPVLIVVVSCLLWTILGPQLTIGVAILLLFLPICQVVVARMLHLRSQRSRLTDTRINVLTTMLQGIRVTKLNHYESQVEEHVRAIRSQEMQLLHKELSMWGWVLVCAITSPLLATTVAFSFYALVPKRDDGGDVEGDGSSVNILTPANVFSGLLLFTILRFPINMTARLVGKTAQAVESIRRISHFLQRPIAAATTATTTHKESRRRREGSEQRHDADDDDESLQPVVDMKYGAFCIIPNQDEILLDAATVDVGASRSNAKNRTTGKRPRREQGQKQISRSSLQTKGSSGSKNMIQVEEEEEDQHEEKYGDEDDDKESASGLLHQIPFVIRDLNFQLHKGELLAVVGKVGSGKTVLLQALLGEVPPMDATVLRKSPTPTPPCDTTTETTSSASGVSSPTVNEPLSSTSKQQPADETSQSSSCLSVAGRVAYAPQIPFIINKSLRENVLFGSKYHPARYEEVLDVCCLRHDIQRLGPAGDLTQIGERGVTLSGGQKQRVALARAVYAQADLTLLDDCFSALDSNTARRVFDGLFGKGEQQKDANNNDIVGSANVVGMGNVDNDNDSDGTVGLLRRGGTILVTHAVHFLPRADKILILSEGTPLFFGTWEELQQGNEKTKMIVEDHDRTDTSNSRQQQFNAKLRRDGILEEDGFIMTIEERQYGISSFGTWLQWFSHAGGWSFFISQLLFLIIDRGFYVAGDWWLARWADAAYTGMDIGNIHFPPQTDGREAQARYVAVYVIIVALSVLATIIRSQWAFRGGARCARKMFDAMTIRILRAPLSYFETTPLGRVLNRFTYDVEVLDVELSVSMTGLMVSFSWLMSAIIVVIAVLPWIMLGMIPVTAVYCLIQFYYRMSGPDLQRIDAVSRSPLQAGLAESLEGTTSIRAFKKEKRFTIQFRRHVDHNTSAMLNFLAAQRWLGLRIELLGATIGFSVTTIIVCANGVLRLPAGLIGLGVQWSYVFTAALNFFFQRLSECEARITSIERVHETAKLPQEASWETDSSLQLDPAWPTKGELEFVAVCMRYRKELPLALDSVSFTLRPGMRCGVVGRTGSGKTSLTASLFRLVEVESGRIMLDGVDLAKIGLSDVRGRSNGLRILPQDPVLYSGTLRDCIDPFQCESDEKIIEALQAVNHNGARSRGAAILQDRVEEGGSNFSVGERQLLCLARAIVEQPRVLCLDEATASVDHTTDTFIQSMLRTRFQNTTLLTVAHRLNTIMDYDAVLVLDQGRCIEFGSPKRLLENPNGTFTAFVDATGPESAAELRDIAFKTISSFP